MSLNISGSNFAPATRSTSTRDITSAALELVQNVAQLAQSLVKAQGGCLPPSNAPVDCFKPSSCVPADRFQAAYDSMEPGKAAQTVLDHFNAIEGVGVDASGAGAGDSNIGRRELERVADPNSGFPPEARAAAKWLLDHPISARSIDQGASKAHGDPNEYHFSREDLKALASGTPSATAGAASVSRFEKSIQASVDLCGTGRQPNCFPSKKELDVYSAANVLKNHFKFIEGVGMDASGRGAGDENIGLSELKRVAEPNSGAPGEVREAAKFLLDHRTALRSVDQGASKNPGGNSEEVHISRKDLDAFTASAPTSSKRPGALGLAQLVRQLSIYG